MTKSTQIESSALSQVKTRGCDNGSGAAAGEPLRKRGGGRCSARIIFRIVDENRLFQFLATGLSLPTV